MPFVAMRASVREVLPWSYRADQILLLKDVAAITYNVGEYTDLYPIHQQKSLYEASHTHISDFFGIVLEADELLWTDDRHFVDDAESSFLCRSHIMVKKSGYYRNSVSHKNSRIMRMLLEGITAETFPTAKHARQRARHSSPYTLKSRPY